MNPIVKQKKKIIPLLLLIVIIVLIALYYDSSSRNYTGVVEATVLSNTSEGFRKDPGTAC